MASLKSFAQKQSEAADAADSTEEKIPYKEEVQEKVNVYDQDKGVNTNWLDLTLTLSAWGPSLTLEALN